MSASDTKVTSLRVTILHVVTDPLVYLRLSTKIRSAHEAGGLPPVVTVDESQQLVYLRGCLVKGPRVFPAVMALRKRVVPKDDDTICGPFLPEGTNIDINMRASIRDETSSAPESDIYRPDRRLDAVSEALQ